MDGEVLVSGTGQSVSITATLERCPDIPHIQIASAKVMMGWLSYYGISIYSQPHNSKAK